jgi:hypothetical protein
MASAPEAKPAGPLRKWLLQGQVHEAAGPYERPTAQEQQHPWWQVMCLTGLDYFSTLGYQPGIAALAAGALAPIATLVLVLLTLFALLPVYYRVAQASPNGEGSIAMLEQLLSQWAGKIFVLCLLGFVATAFIITITLSSADATAHIVENPFFPAALSRHPVGITLVLIGILAAVFLKGLKEAVGIAVVLVGVYLVLNAAVMFVAFQHILQPPEVVAHWKSALYTAPGVHGNPLLMVAFALLLFPRLALGLSGFETGVAVMPLVKGDPDDTASHPRGRIRNTRKLLTAAALIMSVYLTAGTFAAIVLIPPAEFAVGGKANGRALAYLAHQLMGNAFGTAYDVSTIFILWFAGASAMAGLLNIVPRYLPRYGMAPDWTRAVRPLVLVFGAIAFAVTIIFHASVDKQGGAYATGVLVLMSSGAIAVALQVQKRGNRLLTAAFWVITAVFFYTTFVNMYERPEGVKIALLFIGAIIVTSFLSRIYRSTELRTERVEVSEVARKIIQEAIVAGEIHIIANRRQKGDDLEYRYKEQEQREENNIPPEVPVLFLEVDIMDASEFADVVTVRGVEIRDSGRRGRLPGREGRIYRILRAESSAVPNAIAAFLLYLRDTHHAMPHAYFAWSEGNPVKYLVSYVLFGQGDTAPVTHEVLRRAEPDPARRPAIHIGG